MRLFRFFCILVCSQFFKFAGADGHEAEIHPSAIDEFQNVIQFASFEAIEQFQQNPDQLEEVLKELSLEISSYTIDIIKTTIKNLNSFDAIKISTKISQAFENALTIIQRSQRKKIDIDSIVISVYTELQQILNQFIAQDNQPFSLNDKLQDLFSEIFLTGLFEPISDFKQPNKQLNNEQIIELLQKQDINAAIQKIQEFLLNNGEIKIAQIFLKIIGDQQLENILVPTLVQLYAQINIQNNFIVIQSLSRALGAAYNDAPKEITSFLTKIILKLQKYQKNSGMMHALADALCMQKDHQITQLFKQSIALAISQEGCTSIAQLLMDSKVTAKKQNSENVKIFTENVLSDGQIAKCMHIADELHVTVSILSMLEEPEEAFQLVLNAFSNRQDAAIAMSVIRGIDAGQENEVVLLLSLMFQEEEILTNQIGLVLSLALSQGDKDVAGIILKGIGQLKKKKDLGKIAKVVNFAFESGTKDMKRAFEFLLEESVRFDICGLKNVLEEVFLEGKGKAVLNVLESNPTLQICIEEKFFDMVDKKLVYVPIQENFSEQINNGDDNLPSQENQLVEFQNSISGRINDTVQINKLDIKVAPSQETESNKLKNFTSNKQNFQIQEPDFEFSIIPQNDDYNFNSTSINFQNLQNPMKNSNFENSTQLNDDTQQPNFQVNYSNQNQTPTEELILFQEVGEYQNVPEIPNFETNPSPQNSFTKSNFKNISDNNSINQVDYCDDIQPPGEFTCQQQAQWQKCDKEWIITGKFCRKSCGFCTSAENQATQNQFSGNQSPEFEQWQFSIKDLQPIIDQITLKARTKNSGENNVSQPIECELDHDLLVRIAKQAVSEALQSNT